MYGQIFLTMVKYAKSGKISLLTMAKKTWIWSKNIEHSQKPLFEQGQNIFEQADGIDINTSLFIQY